MNDIMLRISHISKQYKLGQIGGTTLREEIQRWNAKRRHEEDPTKKIGEREYEIGEIFKALDDVSLEVKKGERVGIIGHNGAGKSTLLKLISRITAPTSGDIWMNGRVASMLEVGTGFHGELTGRENIYMNGAILGMKKKEIDAKIEDIIEFSECRQFIDTPVKRYSSGMYVKLAFSVAAHLDSEIMIMDEVLAVGDMAFQKKCLEKMSIISKSEGRTILYVSHNMNTIRKLCDRCIVLDHGKVIYDGDVEEGIDKYLNINTNSSNTVNLEAISRQPEFKLHSITLKKLTIEAENNIFSSGSELSGSVLFTTTRSYENAYMTIYLKSASGIALTKFTSKKIIIGNSISYLLMFTLDITRFAPGKYTLDIAVSERGRYGAFERLDGVHNAYYFEIVGEKDVDGRRTWNTLYDGYYLSPSMKTSLLHCISEDNEGNDSVE